MMVNGKPYRTIWADENGVVRIIDQRSLPHRFVVSDIRDCDRMCIAIREMHVRGAGLIGAAAGFGMYLAAREAAGYPDPSAFLKRAASSLLDTRPTAVTLSVAVRRQLTAMEGVRDAGERITTALATAIAIADEDAEACRRIGEHGVALIRDLYLKRKRTVNILTHCNAGWLAFVDYGSAMAPVYAAHGEGIPVHVWVDETRPRNQGAALTAWELGEQGIPHHLVADNTGGHLMQHGMVDIVITGADRVTAAGDAANKIGTYLKALAARDNGVPFHIAFPGTTIDWSLEDGVGEIEIEERGEEEVRHVSGVSDGRLCEVLVCPEGTPAVNYGFDVTPSRLVSGFITERGLTAATREGLSALYPECRP